MLLIAKSLVYSISSTDPLSRGRFSSYTQFSQAWLIVAQMMESPSMLVMSMLPRSAVLVASSCSCPSVGFTSTMSRLPSAPVSATASVT